MYLCTYARDSCKGYLRFVSANYTTALTCYYMFFYNKTYLLYKKLIKQFRKSIFAD